MYDLTRARSKEMRAFSVEIGFKDILLVTENPQEQADSFLISKIKDYRKEILEARKKIDIVIVLGRGDAKENRNIIESSPDVLLSPHHGSKKDFMKERGSGLDHVICRIAAKNKIAIGIDFSEILNADEKERVAILGRIIQNIKLCRKYKVKVLFASFASSLFEMRAVQDLMAFAQAIGMTPVEAKKSLSTAADIIRRNKEKRSPEYISEGIRVIK